MAMWQVALVLLAGVAVQGEKVSPVQKVMSLIDDMVVKVKADVESNNAGFEEYAKFCDDDATESDYAIKSTKGQIEALSASVEDSAAKIASLTSKAEATAQRISDAEGELVASDKLRAKEKADFIATETQMVETVKELSNGVKVLESTLELVQLTPAAKKGLDSVVASLEQIVDADFVTHAQRSRVRAFLQAKEDAEESFTLKSQSPAVLDVIRSMLGRAEGTLTDLRKKEMENGQSAALLQHGLKNEIASLNEEMSETTKSTKYNEEVKATTEGDLSLEKKGLAQAEKALSEEKIECQQRASEYEAEVKDAEAELAALAKAKGILSKKFSLIETHVAEQAHDDGDVRARALRHIEKLGRKFHSTALVALAYRAASDPFGKVRSMIEDMIAKLQQEAAEEADQKAFCDTETGKSKKSQAEKEESLAKTQARIDKSDATIAKLSELVATLSGEVRALDTSVSDATAIRQKEAAAFAKAEKDYSESAEAVATAISVLREYYEGAALVQMKAHQMVSARGDGSGIIGILEVAESDFSKLLAEARAVEEASVSDFKKFTEESKLSKATMTMDIKGKESEIKSLKTGLADYGEDKESTSAELTAVLDYLAELKPQCERVGPTYAERKAAREAEIQGLKEGLHILSGGPALAQVGQQRLRGLGA